MFTSIGDRVRELRERENMSQLTLSERIGVTKETVSRIETGRNNPSMEALNRICDVFGLTLSEFFAPTDPKQSQQTSGARDLTSVVEARDVFDAESLNQLLQGGWILIATGVKQNPSGGIVQFYTVGRPSSVAKE